MRVSGVLSSCDASATNCRCLRAALSIRSSISFIVEARRAISSVWPGTGNRASEIGAADVGHLSSDELDGKECPADQPPDERSQNGDDERHGDNHGEPQVSERVIEIVDVLRDV